MTQTLHRSHIRRALSSSSAAALTLLTALAAQAQNEDEQSEPVGEQPDVITVYGASTPLPVFEYPGQVSVVTRDLVDTFAPSAMSDLLRDVPGIDFAGGPRRTGETPNIRGLSGENLLILVDGARQSFISAHDGRFFVDPDLLRAVEVVRGPASALYGSGALGGVMAMETVTAADFLTGGQTHGVRTRIGYQDVNEESFAALTGYGRSGMIDVIGSVGFRDSGDIALGSGEDLRSDDDIVSGLLKATLTPSDALILDASWTGFRNEALEPNNGQGVVLPDDATLGRDVEKDVDTDTLRLRLGFAPVGQSWIDAQFTAYQTVTSVDEFDQSTGRTAGREIETTGFTARNSTRLDLGGVDTALTVGADWYRDEQTGSDTTSQDGDRAGVPNGESSFLGVFIEAQTRFDLPYGLPGDVLIIPGVRFDEFESEADGQQNVSDDAVSPRLSVSYGPVAPLRFFVSYAEGFRAPSINELYLDGIHFPLPHPVLFDPMAGPPGLVFVNNNFIPNEDLMPEKAENLEIGVSFDTKNALVDGDRFQAKLSYFETQIEDFINLSVNIAFDPTCFAPPFFAPCTAGTTESANLDNAEIQGVEFEATYDAPRLRLAGFFTSIEGEDTATNADIGTLTPDRLALDARVKFPAFAAALGARLQAAAAFERSEALDTGQLVVAEERDSYAVVDVYGTWSPAFLNGLRIDAGIDNVFDEDYERVFEGVSEPGISPRIALTYQIGFGD